MNINGKQFIVGLLAASCFAILLYITLESPLLLRNPIAGIKIGSGQTDYFLLTSNQFTCTSGQNCSVALEGKTLQINASVTPGGTLLGCNASYDEKPVSCEQGYTMFNTAKLGIYINDDLGISAERMSQIRSQHPLLYWQEATWLTVSNLLPVLVTILLIAFWMFRPQKRSARLLTCSARLVTIVLFGGFVWFGSIMGLIALGYVD